MSLIPNPSTRLDADDYSDDDDELFTDDDLPCESSVDAKKSQPVKAAVDAGSQKIKANSGAAAAAAPQADKIGLGEREKLMLLARQTNSTRKTEVMLTKETEDRALNGDSTATKIISVSVDATRAELLAGKEQKFERALLEEIFKVHARNTDNRSYRVGDISSVVINSVKLHQSYNGSDSPVVVSMRSGGDGDGAVEGKIYLTTTPTGPVKDRKRALCILNPGGFNPAAPVLLASNVKEDLLEMSRILGAFDITVLKKGYKVLRGTKKAVLYDGHYLSRFIHSQCTRWHQSWESYPFDADGAFRIVPLTLIEFTVSLLEKMDSHMKAHKHNLGSLAFNFQSDSTRGSVIVSYLPTEEKVTVNAVFEIGYTFLDKYLLDAQIVEK